MLATQTPVILRRLRLGTRACHSVLKQSARNQVRGVGTLAAAVRAQLPAERYGFLVPAEVALPQLRAAFAPVREVAPRFRTRLILEDWAWR